VMMPTLPWDFDNLTSSSRTPFPQPPPPYHEITGITR
jgi:hypothetical protein